LAVDISNSLLTTVTWTAYYATTTADTFGTIGTPTKTSIATGTFTVTSTLTRYTANISVPAAATTGIEILFTVGAQISGTWQIGNVQFEPGAVATPYERRLYGQELMLCQRYLPVIQPAATGSSYTFGGSCNQTTSLQAKILFPVTPRVPPTGIVATTASGFAVNDGVTSTAATAIAFTTADYAGSLVTATVASGLTQFRFASLTTSTTTQIQFTGCEIP
jgi:hypothetical protein